MCEHRSPRATVLTGRSFTYDQPASRVLFGAGDAAQGLFDLAVRLGAPVALKDIGMPADGLDRAAQLATANPYDNPRPIDYASVRELLEHAPRRASGVGARSGPRFSACHRASRSVSVIQTRASCGR